MAKFKMILLVGVAWPFLASANGLLLFDDAPAASASPLMPAPAQPAYQPVNPPLASVAPILDVEPSVMQELEMKPNESEAEFYNRTKRYYERSVDHLKQTTEAQLRSMESMRAPGY